MVKFAFIAALALAILAGCGFQLRGQATLPAVMAVTTVDDGQAGLPTPMELSLQRLLQQQGVVLASDEQAATAVLRLVSTTFRQRTLASGSGGALRDYQFSLQVEYRLLAVETQQNLSADTVTVSRNAQYREDQVLGKVAGEEIVYAALTDDAALAIVRQLQALGGS